MAVIRAFVAVAAVVAFAYALNLFVLRESMFNQQVLVPMAIGAGLAAVWLLLQLISLSKSGRGATIHGINTVIGSIAYLGICVVIFAFAKRHDREWDLTREGRRDLAPQTSHVL